MYGGFRQMKPCVRNAAGIGAKKVLISKSKRKEAQVIADRLLYIELATRPDFMEIFTRKMIVSVF